MAEEEKKLQPFLPDPFRVVPAAIGEAGKDLADLGSDALELVYGKERTDKIEGALSGALKFIDDTLDKTAVGKAATQALEKTFYPKDLNVVEELGKEIGSYLVPGTAASKLLKAGKATTRLGKFAKYGTAGVIADVIAKDEDEQYLKEMMDLVGLKGKSKEVDELVAKLDINPDDTVSERLLKQTIDSTGLAVTVGIPTSLALGLFKFGGSKAIGKYKALKKDKITTPVTNTADNVASNVEVIQQSPGQFLQRGKLISAAGKINTKLGRILSSKASMPDKVFNAYIRKNKYAEGKELLVKQGAKDLEEAIKNQTKSLDDAAKEVVRTDVNKVLQGQTPVGQLSQEVTDITKRLRRNIDIQSNNLKNILNLSDKNKLGIAIDKNLNSYITKSYEFYTNPAWAKKLKKGLRGDLDNINDTDTIDRINDMRTYLQKINPTLTSSQIDGVLDKFIDGVTKKTSGQYDTLTGIMGFSAGGKPIKIFKQRKALDDRLINFLGEVKDPYRNYIETMRNLNKGIAKAQYFKDIKKFADENLGQEIKLGGLIPSIGIGKFNVKLPTASTKILKENQIGLNNSIGDIVAKEMGVLGGDGKAFGLNKYMTTDMFSEMVERGIDTFDTNMAVGSGFLNALKRTVQRTAGVTQAAETVYDHTAHMVNMFGMFQTLATNGHIFRGKEFAKAAKTVYQKAFLKKDPEALKFFAKAKEKGVVDSSVSAEMVRRNLDVLDENLAESGIKRRLRKAGRIPSEFYGLTDDFGKLTALQAEIKSYKKALNLTDDEAFDYAAEVVRNTMPSYTTAVPLVRKIAQTPFFGTYATFPAEILRTNFNIVKTGLNDLTNGITTGNKDLALIGLRRLSGAAATTAGIDYVFNRNNEDEFTGMGVTKESQKGINHLVSDWQKSTSKYYTSPIYEDKKGKIRTSFVDSGSLDANQYTKNIVKGVMGKVLSGGNVSETELEDKFDNAFTEMYSPFVSEKFLFGALLNLYRGRDENGRELTTKQAMINVGKVFVPGTAKSAYRLYKAAEAEEKARYDGLPIASNDRGYPIKFEDEFQHFYSGIRTSNMDVTKSVGTFIYNENQKLKQPIKQFTNDLRGYDSKVYTQSDIDKIVDMYLDSQIEKKKLMRQFSDRLNTIKNIEYYSKQGSNAVKKRFGIEKIIEANTGMGRKKIDDSVLYALQDGEDGTGFFMPDNVLNTPMIMTILKDKKLPPELLDALINVQGQLTGTRIRK